MQARTFRSPKSVAEFESNLLDAASTAESVVRLQRSVGSSVEMRPSSFPNGGRLYEPRLSVEVVTTSRGCAVTATPRLPGRLVLAVGLAAGGFFLAIAILIGLVGVVRGEPIRSDQGDPLFPFALWPPALFIVIGLGLNAYYSRLANETIGRMLDLLEELTDAA